MSGKNILIQTNVLVCLIILAGFLLTAILSSAPTTAPRWKMWNGFDSVFLISTASGRYYNFQGLDRLLTRDNPENV